MRFCCSRVLKNSRVSMLHAIMVAAFASLTCQLVTIGCGIGLVETVLIKDHPDTPLDYKPPFTIHVKCISFILREIQSGLLVERSSRHFSHGMGEISSSSANNNSSRNIRLASATYPCTILRNSDTVNWIFLYNTESPCQSMCLSVVVL